MKIGKPGAFDTFKVNGRRIVMSRNSINGAARPIKNCNRQDVYEAMADIYDEFYFKEIDTDKMIPIEWIKQWLENCDAELFDNVPISTYCDGYQNNVIECLLNSWEKENETNAEC